MNHLHGGPTAVMLLEHQEIRKCLDAIACKLAEENFETEAEDMQLKAALCPHNHKEEGIVYPVMDQVFSERERAKMFLEINNKKRTPAPRHSWP